MLAPWPPVRVTCSWADEALTKHWYPPGVPAASGSPSTRSTSTTVEVDSTYYRLPDEEMVERWAERTPRRFVMHVKAFGVMTRHPVKVEQLPPDLREEAPVDDRGRVDRRRASSAPRSSGASSRRSSRCARRGKLGGILFQFPPYVVPKRSSLDYLEWARDQLGGDELLVEFRPPLLVRGGQPPETLALPRGARACARRRRRAAARRRRTCRRPCSRVTTPLRTSASTAGTPGPGTCAAGARPSASTTSTPRTSCASGCRAARARRAGEQAYAFFNNNNRSPGPGRRAGRPGRPGTRTCSRSCWRKEPR